VTLTFTVLCLAQADEVTASLAKLRALTPAQFESLFKLAKHGDATAENAVGMAYVTGNGLLQDEREGIKWLRRAAAHGSDAAENALGVLYQSGRGVAQNPEAAAHWYIRSASHGNTRGQYNAASSYLLGAGVGKNYDEAMKWYMVAALKGDAAAQNDLAYMYEYGLGTELNQAEALKWYRKAAEQGYALAQDNLGVTLQKTDSAESHAEALAWYRRAAEQGNASAQLNLAAMLVHGHCMPQDFQTAYTWLLIATAKSESRATEPLASWRKRLSSEQLAAAESRASSWLARHKTSPAVALAVSDKREQ
jgi:TPR repeat protein